MFANVHELPHIDPIFRALKDSISTFYLTGSRFFGGFRPDSDWDFFVEYSYDVKVFLSAHGFSKIHDRNDRYKDECCKEVWRFSRGAFQVDIQLVSSALVKDRAQKYIVSSFPIYRMYRDAQHKYQREIFWNMAYALHTHTLGNYYGYDVDKKEGEPDNFTHSWKYEGWKEQLKAIGG